MKPPLPGITSAAVGVAALAVAATSPSWGPLGLVVAVPALLVAATSLSRAGRLASSLPPLAGKRVQVTVWGDPLPNHEGVALQVESIRPFGAALLLHLRPAGGGGRHLLKVAQPRDVHVAPDHLSIGRAAYVSWAGTRLPRQSTRPALHLSWPVP